MREFNKDELYKKLPLWNRAQILMVTKQKYPIIVPPKKITFLPSLTQNIQFISNNINIKKKQKSNKEIGWLKNYVLESNSLPYENKFKTAAKQWFFNIKTLNAISKSFGANYLVFLQPTMAIETKSNILDMHPLDLEIYKSTSKEYFKEINSLYSELRRYCNLVEYCIDISSKIKSSKNIYSDPRHFNQTGEKLLGELISKEIKNSIIKK